MAEIFHQQIPNSPQYLLCPGEGYHLCTPDVVNAWLQFNQGAPPGGGIPPVCGGGPQPVIIGGVPSGSGGCNNPNGTTDGGGGGTCNPPPNPGTCDRHAPYGVSHTGGATGSSPLTFDWSIILDNPADGIEPGSRIASCVVEYIASGGTTGLGIVEKVNQKLTAANSGTSTIKTWDASAIAALNAALAGPKPKSLKVTTTATWTSPTTTSVGIRLVTLTWCAPVVG